MSRFIKSFPQEATGDAILEAAQHGDVFLNHSVYHLDRPLVLPEGRSIYSDLGEHKRPVLRWSPRAKLENIPGSQQASMVTVYGATVSGITFDCRFPRPVDCALGGAVAFWGSSVIRNCHVTGTKNGFAKEGFGLFSAGDVLDSSASMTQSKTAMPETTFIAGQNIERCNVNLSGYGGKARTHAFTPLGPSSVIRRCKASGTSVGVYHDTHDLRSLEIDSCYLNCESYGIQLSGPVSQGATARHKSVRASITRCFLRGNPGIYVFLPLYVDNGVVHRWWDVIVIEGNNLLGSDSGVTVQAASPESVGRVAAFCNVLPTVRGLYCIEPNVYASDVVIARWNGNLDGDEVTWGTRQ